MNTKCQNCETRQYLLDADFVLQSRMTGANVHRLANARCVIIGALDFVRLGRPDCERCINTLAKVPLIDINPINP